MADDLQGRTFLVTGANSGIGRAMVEALAARGGHVVLAARSEERTRPVLEGIRALRPSAAVEFLQVDVSDLASVRRAASAYLATGRQLDVLVNNAGVGGTNGLSADGFDLTYATNHIGPFLLTSLLLPRNRAGAAGTDRQRLEHRPHAGEADRLDRCSSGAPSRRRAALPTTPPPSS